MAGSTRHPRRVVGLHFFNPVNKMPLVEVVRAPQSDDASIATAVALCTKLGKTPVVVADAPGFLVNRLLIPHLAEAIALAAEGVPVPTIDDAIKRWGMPMGPFELLDEIGLDVALHVLRSLGHVMVDPPAIPPQIEAAVKAGTLGKKSGKGFYVHGGKGEGEPRLNPELSLAAATSAAPPGAEEIQWRLMLPMVNEAARVLAEGVTDSADDVDLATVLGLGFAPFRGGVAQFADDTGLATIVAELDQLATKHGQRFTPAESLRRRAEAGESFPRPAAPPKAAKPQPAATPPPPPPPRAPVAT
jgi:3-hydroxyacyl-CoA dehydrogenase